MTANRAQLDVPNNDPLNPSVAVTDPVTTNPSVKSIAPEMYEAVSADCANDAVVATDAVATVHVVACVELDTNPFGLLEISSHVLAAPLT